MMTRKKAKDTAEPLFRAALSIAALCGMTRGYGIPTPNTSSRFFTSPGSTPEKATRMRTSPARGCGSSMSPTTNPPVQRLAFSCQAAFMILIRSPVRLLHFSMSEHSAAIQPPIWRNLPMCGRYRLSRRKQMQRTIGHWAEYIQNAPTQG
jgi:hypothetical protein